MKHHFILYPEAQLVIISDGAYQNSSKLSGMLFHTADIHLQDIPFLTELLNRCISATIADVLTEDFFDVNDYQTPEQLKKLN